MIPAIKAHNEYARENGKGEINVIVVNACESDEHAHELSRCVDFAIGHKAPVGDNKANDFTDSFYRNMFKGMHLAGTFGTARSVSSKGYQLHAQKDPGHFCLVIENDGDDGLRSKRRRGDERCVSDANSNMHVDIQTHEGKSPKAGSARKTPKTALGEEQSNLYGKIGDACEGSSSGAPLKSRRSDLDPAIGSASSAKRQRLDSDPDLDAAGNNVGGGALIGGDVSAAADCDTSSLRGAFPYDVFISPTWDRQR